LASSGSIERDKTVKPSKTENWRISSQTDSDERMDGNGRNYCLDHVHRQLRYLLDSYQSLERYECQSRGHVASVMDLASNWVALPSEIGSVAENYPDRTITHNNATGISCENSPPNEESKVTGKETYDSNKGGIFRSLPNGWEEVFLQDGRIMFKDHNTGVKTFVDPRSVEKSSITSEMQYSKKFESKYKSFIKRISSLKKSPHMFEITVNRDKIVQDSFRIIMSLTPDELIKMRSRLWVKFENEPGLDYGGVSKEWFSEVSKELLNPYYGLFEYSAIDNYTLQINPNSEVCVDNHLEYFRFLGRLAGMAALHKRLLNGFFIKPFYKVLLQEEVNLKDMEQVDVDYYNSLKWIQDNDPSCLDLTFTMEKDMFGETVTTELKPGGRNIPVKQNNKKEFIKLVIQERFQKRVRAQMANVMLGFADVVPLHYLGPFGCSDLELILSGMGIIDVEDWSRHTEYKGGYTADHPLIKMFWRIVSSFTDEMQSRLLQFVTGTSRVPLQGFSELQGSTGPRRFLIEKTGSPDELPKSHTCFNRLDLPEYRNYKELCEKLVMAVEDSCGFDFE